MTEFPKFHRSNGNIYEEIKGKIVEQREEGYVDLLSVWYNNHEYSIDTRDINKADTPNKFEIFIAKRPNLSTFIQIAWPFLKLALTILSSQWIWPILYHKVKRVFL